MQETCPLGPRSMLPSGQHSYMLQGYHLCVLYAPFCCSGASYCRHAGRQGWPTLFGCVAYKQGFYAVSASLLLAGQAPSANRLKGEFLNDAYQRPCHRSRHTPMQKFLGQGSNPCHHCSSRVTAMMLLDPYPAQPQGNSRACGILHVPLKKRASICYNPPALLNISITDFKHSGVLSSQRKTSWLGNLIQISDPSPWGRPLWLWIISPGGIGPDQTILCFCPSYPSCCGFIFISLGLEKSSVCLVLF